MKLTKRNRCLYIFSYLLVFCSLFILPIKAVSATVSEDYPHIYDDAGLLSTNEYENLEEMSIAYGNDVGLQIYILTHNKSNELDADDYIETFYDNYNFGDSIILLIDMSSREVVIHGYGLAETYIHSKRIDRIIEDISPLLSNEKYYEAFETYIKQSAKYMQDDSELNYDHNYNISEDSIATLIRNPWFQLFGSLVIGGIVVSIMGYNSSGKMTTGSNTYLDKSKSGLIGKRDYYLRTRITRVKKPTSNSSSRGGINSGGFRGGVSRGGHSHSSGRGKF